MSSATDLAWRARARNKATSSRRFLRLVRLCLWHPRGRGRDVFRRLSRSLCCSFCALERRRPTSSPSRRDLRRPTVRLLANLRSQLTSWALAGGSPGACRVSAGGERGLDGVDEGKACADKPFVCRPPAHIRLVAASSLPTTRAVDHGPDEGRRQERLGRAELNRRSEPPMTMRAVNLPKGLDQGHGEILSLARCWSARPPRQLRND